MEEIKRCNNCGRFLGVSSFGESYDKRDGKYYRRGECRKCQRIKFWIWSQFNKDKIRQYTRLNKEQRKKYYKQYREDNLEKENERNRKYKRENKEKIAHYNDKYRRQKLSEFAAYENKKRAEKRNQTPPDSNDKKINYIYRICEIFNELEDETYHVDHIKPLAKGGLHHQSNLQILEATLNMEKHSSHPLTEIEELRYSGITLEMLERGGRLT